MAIVYTWCQENRGRQTSFFFITLEARLLWPAFLFMTFLMAGWKALLEDLAGIVAAHLYDFLTIYWPKYGGGANLFFTPAFLAGYFGANQPPRPVGRQEVSTGEGRSAATSPGFSSWSSRGQGRRLGGN